MKRLFPILFFYFCLIACHKSTTNGSTNDDYAANDSIVLEKVKYSIIQYCDSKHPCEEQMHKCS